MNQPHFTDHLLKTEKVLVPYLWKVPYCLSVLAYSIVSLLPDAHFHQEHLYCTLVWAQINQSYCHEQGQQRNSTSMKDKVDHP